METIDINSQKYIYFCCPMGSWVRINNNLDHLGLSNIKRICNTLTIDFNKSLMENTYQEKYIDYDVIILDEFYDGNIDYELFLKALPKFAKEKQIVMAGHGTLESLKEMPGEFKRQIKCYDLLYDLDYKNYDETIKYIE